MNGSFTFLIIILLLFVSVSGFGFLYSEYAHSQETIATQTATIGRLQTALNNQQSTCAAELDTLDTNLSTCQAEVNQLHSQVDQLVVEAQDTSDLLASCIQARPAPQSVSQPAVVEAPSPVKVMPAQIQLAPDVDFVTMAIMVVAALVIAAAAVLMLLLKNI